MFDVIECGYGYHEIAEGFYKEKNALIIGRKGTGNGILGSDLEGNREMPVEDALCVFTFANRESIEIMQEKLEQIKERM